MVRSMIWSGMTKSLGLMSSRREPTAEKAMMLRTPMDRRAAMLARAGTSWGANWWWMPWRARKATGTPLCRAMRMGDEGKPHGVSGLTVATGSKPGMWLRPVPPMTAMWTGSARGVREINDSRNCKLRVTSDRGHSAGESWGGAHYP